MPERVAAWQGDIEGRLRERINSLGANSLEEFLKNRSCIGYLELAKLLSKDERDDVAAMQIYMLQMRAARESDCLRDAAIDALPRFLSECVPEGWNAAEDLDSNAARAFAAWSSTVRTDQLENKTLDQRLLETFKALMTLSPPIGWLPVSNDDAFIVQAFAIGWPG